MCAQLQMQAFLGNPRYNHNHIWETAASPARKCLFKAMSLANLQAAYLKTQATIHHILPNHLPEAEATPARRAWQ